MTNVLGIKRRYSQSFQTSNSRHHRQFKNQDIPSLIDKIFSQFDSDKNQRFSKDEFPKVLNSIIDLVGGDCPSSDDVEDIFNLLDENGDETIDRKEFTTILKIFFQLLKEKDIEVEVCKETDVLF